MIDSGIILNFLIWPERPQLSIAVLAMLLVVLLYMARGFAHGLVLTVSGSIHRSFRLAARGIQRAVITLKKRNKEVLLSGGAELLERQIEREFQRIGDVVSRDLQPYPALHRSISDLVTSIDDDYRKSTETPPEPAQWQEAVQAISALPTKDDSLVGRMLSQIKKALDIHHKESIKEYRKHSAIRHGLLKKLMPSWRKVSGTLTRVERTISGILSRAEVVDQKVLEYKEALAGTERAERMLSSSSMTQFFISGLWLVIAMGGAIVNFNLIALPMSEMVGGASYLGPFKMSNVAALVIILVEAAMGMYLMEGLRITRLFPVISSMEDTKRLRFVWSAFVILVIMALIESSLAFMRDIIMADKQALIQSLSGAEGALAPASMSWIPLVGQMVMGFILPFALAFVAIPFESFVHSTRTVFGVLCVGFLSTLAFVLRLLGNMSLGVGKVLVSAYDLVAFPLLWLESILRIRAAAQVLASVQKEVSGEVAK